MTHALKAAVPEGPSNSPLDWERVHALTAQIPERERLPRENLTRS
jgi:hypothetical protein